MTIASTSLIDLVRWLVILCASFSIGVMAALYIRLDRIILPKVGMALLVASNVIVNVGVIYATYIRLHRHQNFQSPIIAVGTIFEVIALLELYHWYGTAQGREHMRRMQAPRQKESSDI